MAPRLKILMSSGSNKETQIIFSFLSKVPENESPPGSPDRAHMEIYPLTGHLAYFSKTS
jgi:hypothetical protein